MEDQAIANQVTTLENIPKQLLDNEQKMDTKITVFMESITKEVTEKLGKLEVSLSGKLSKMIGKYGEQGTDVWKRLNELEKNIIETTEEPPVLRHEYEHECEHELHNAPLYTDMSKNMNYQTLLC